MYGLGGAVDMVADQNGCKTIAVIVWGVLSLLPIQTKPNLVVSSYIQCSFVHIISMYQLTTISKKCVCMYIWISCLCGGDMRTCLHALATGWMPIMSKLRHELDDSFKSRPIEFAGTCCGQRAYHSAMTQPKNRLVLVVWYYTQVTTASRVWARTILHYQADLVRLWPQKMTVFLVQCFIIHICW